MRPYDGLIIAGGEHISQHIGIVVDEEWFCHTRRRTGVVLERMTRWVPYLLQVIRLRSLL